MDMRWLLSAIYVIFVSANSPTASSNMLSFSIIILHFRLLLSVLSVLPFLSFQFVTSNSSATYLFHLFSTLFTSTTIVQQCFLMVILRTISFNTSTENRRLYLLYFLTLSLFSQSAVACLHALISCSFSTLYLSTSPFFSTHPLLYLFIYFYFYLCLSIYFIFNLSLHPFSLVSVLKFLLSSTCLLIAFTGMNSFLVSSVICCSLLHSASQHPKSPSSSTVHFIT